MTNVFPEPVWGTPQDVGEACSIFDSRGPTPFLLSGVFLRLLQYHFSDPNNIDEDLLKGYIWTPTSSTCVPGSGTTEVSRIIIRPSWSADTAATGQLPGLFVKREPFKAARMALQDQAAPGLTRNAVYEGERMYVRIEGQHSIICKGMTGGEADLLGQEVFFRMLHYQQVIKTDFGLGHLMTTGVSEVRQRTDESRSTFYTSVGVDWSYIYRWLVVQESPIIKRLVVAQ